MLTERQTRAMFRINVSDINPTGVTKRGVSSFKKMTCVSTASVKYVSSGFTNCLSSSINDNGNYISSPVNISGDSNTGGLDLTWFSESDAFAPNLFEKVPMALPVEVEEKVHFPVCDHNVFLSIPYDLDHVIQITDYESDSDSLLLTNSSITQESGERPKNALAEGAGNDIALVVKDSRSIDKERANGNYGYKEEWAKDDDDDDDDDDKDYDPSCGAKPVQLSISAKWRSNNVNASSRFGKEITTSFELAAKQLHIKCGKSGASKAARVNELTREDFSVTRREKPRHTQADFARADSYWDIIITNSKYIEFVRYSQLMLERLGLKEADLQLFSKRIVFSLLPNYVEIGAFMKEQNVNGWIYELNGKATSPKFALRWCSQKLNFYTASVTRYQVDRSGKKGNRQALCPYCPYSEGMNLSTIFYGTTDSAYMHHITKDHGVYSSGYEMPIPVVCENILNNDHNGKHGQRYGIFCTQCRKVVSNISEADAKKITQNNFLISYYRHCFEEHNIKKQSRSPEDKAKDAEFFSYNGNMLYEPFPV